MIAFDAFLAEAKTRYRRAVQDHGWRPGRIPSPEECLLLVQMLEESQSGLNFYAKEETWGSDDVSRATGNKTFDVCCFDFSRNFKPGKDLAGSKARAVCAELDRLALEFNQ